MSTPFGFCHCGCGKKTTIPFESNAAHRRIRGVPLRFIKNHAAKMRAVGHKVDSNGCWIYSGFINDRGYAGLVSLNGIHTSAYRAAYIKANGPVPQGMAIDHLCRNRKCVNPSNLEAVTPAENTHRSSVPKLTKGGVVLIREMLCDEIPIAEIGHLFGVSKITISDIRRGATWKSVPINHFNKEK